MQASFMPNLLIALTTALLSSAAVFLIWGGDADSEQDRATGEMIAELAARASIDGLIEQDRIELGVVANRLTGLPRVAGVAIFTVENELLALSGALELGTPFIRPIVLDDTLLGFARISLVPTPAASDWIRVASSVLVLLAIALLVAWWSVRMRGGLPRTAERAATAIEFDSASEPVTRYLLVGNLHNQLTLTGLERKRVAERALAVARRIGTIYGYRSSHLPGKGMLLAFRAQEGSGSALDAVCAAFLVADCLAGVALIGTYRFGLHAIEMQAGETLSDNPEAIEDAALLAAMSKPGAVLASNSFYNHLDEPEMLDAEAFSHPMLAQLHVPDKQGHLITGLDKSRRELLGRQASHLARDLRPV